MFRRPSVRYGRTPEPETPYQRAAQAWDERIGSARVQARNWRLMALGELASSPASPPPWSGNPPAAPSCPGSCRWTGSARRRRRPAIANFRPTDPQIAWHLAASSSRCAASPPTRSSSAELAARL